MTGFKKLSSWLVLVIILLVGFNVPSVSAQDDYTITLGKDKEVIFTKFNYHNSWFEDDPSNHEPWPDQREAYSVGNIARASLSATPDHAGVAQALVGVDFEWNLGEYTWEEVKDWPLRFTINFSYQIEAYWAEGHGSANAGVSYGGFQIGDSAYDYIGYETDQAGSRGNTVSETYESTIEDLGARILLQAYCQAHSVYMEDEEGNPIGTTHHSSAEVEINSITIEILNPQITGFSVSLEHFVGPNEEEWYGQQVIATVYHPQGSDQLESFIAIDPTGKELPTDCPMGPECSITSDSWNFMWWEGYLPNPPTFGTYTIKATDKDGRVATVTSWPTDHISDRVPNITDPINHYVTTRVPTFRWVPFNDRTTGYLAEVFDPSIGETIWAIGLPASQTEVQFNSDGTAAVPELTPGKTYHLFVFAYEEVCDEIQCYRDTSIRCIEFTVDTAPPTTTRKFVGNDPENIEIILTATDDLSGVEQIYFSIDGYEWKERSTSSATFSIDLYQIHKIQYFSVDKAGNDERPHTINIENIEEDKHFKKGFVYDPCDLQPSYYDVYFNTHYFKISDENSQVIFVDKVNVDVGPYDLVVPVGLRLYRKGLVFSKWINEKIIGTISDSVEWKNLGAVDWTGKENNYEVYAQLRSRRTGYCGQYLSEGSLPMVISPGGFIYSKIYNSDKIFSVNIPQKGSFLRKIKDRIYPFQSKSHSIKIENGINKASFSISWGGSDLDLFLYDPNGREITPQIADTDHNIDFNEGDNYENYFILNPMGGNWVMEIRAIDVPINGEEYLAIVDLIRSIPATINIEPDTLNLKNKGKYITAYIELPGGYDVSNIDVCTVMLNDQVQAEDNPTEIGDYDDDGIANLMVKFDRSAVQEILEVGDALEITVTGELTDGTPFEGCDTIRVIDKGR